MKVENLKKFCDPIDRCSKLEVFATKVQRGDQCLENVSNLELFEDDIVWEGMLYNQKNGSCYPIRDRLASLLSIGDFDRKDFIIFFDSLEERLPTEMKALVESYLARIKNMSNEASVGWCQDEMEYYDTDVATPSKRQEMLTSIMNDDLWHIFLEREKYLISDARDLLGPGEFVLELGCGNARTITRLLNPRELGLNYIGTDISFNRLQVAKAANPDSEFVQCNSLRLPFRQNQFKAVFAFGVLHHLESPSKGLVEASRVLNQEGRIYIHEPIEKTKKFMDFQWSNSLKASFESYDHSDHDNEICLHEFAEILDGIHALVLKQSYSGSIVRTGVSHLFRRYPRLQNSKNAWRALITVDSAFNKVLCRSPNSLGPNAVYLIIQNEKST
jgi:ubiquinone/menaquinone biosynthesis C-methylase UbiE/uncharacterized protein YbaR (Trm112 family)